MILGCHLKQFNKMKMFLAILETKMHFFFVYDILKFIVHDKNNVLQPFLKICETLNVGLIMSIFSTAFIIFMI